MAEHPRLTVAVGPVPLTENIPALLDTLKIAFPRPENEAYLQALVGTTASERVVAERVGALSLLPTLLERMGVTTTDIALARDERGRPYLLDREGNRPVDFNLSHSNGHVACACVPAPHRVGLDVEEPVPPARAEGLIRRFCTDGELSLLDGRTLMANGAPRPDFTCLWTLREAIAKYEGTGQPLRFDAATPPAGTRLTVMQLSDTGAYLSLCFSGEITALVTVTDGSLRPEVLSDILVT